LFIGFLVIYLLPCCQQLLHIWKKGEHKSTTSTSKEFVHCLFLGQKFSENELSELV
jgi:hypothetical protein